MNPNLASVVAELLGIPVEGLSELTHAEIIERLGVRFDELAASEQATEAATLEALRRLTSTITDVRVEQREAQRLADEAAAEIQAMRSEVQGETPPEEAGEAGEPAEPAEEPAEPAEPEQPAEPAEPTSEAAPAAEAPERVAAAAARVPVARPRPQAHTPQERQDDRPLVTITAAADTIFSAGSGIPSLRDVGRSFAEKAHAALRVQGSTGVMPVASFSLDYDESRQLRADRDDDNWRKIDDVNSPRAMEPILASGGLCAPVAARYELDGISGEHRPIRDSLNRFAADRGGIRFITPPKITDLDDGVLVITAAQDAANTTKPCHVITCGTPVEVDIAAISQCVKVGNFSRRTFPEQFDRFWQLASAEHAREAEQFLLDRMAAVSTATTDGQELGAALDLLEYVRRAASQFRSRNRMLMGATLVMYAPQWLPDIMAADLYREIPGDGPERLIIVTSLIEQMFSAFNVTCVWYADTATGEGQVYGAQGAGALLGWQTSPVMFMTHPGAFLFLDGGELNLGLEIRDSVVNATNDVLAHTETFENLAFVGIQSLQLNPALCVNGTTSATSTLSCPRVS